MCDIHTTPVCKLIHMLLFYNCINYISLYHSVMVIISVPLSILVIVVHHYSELYQTDNFVYEKW